MRNLTQILLHQYIACISFFSHIVSIAFVFRLEIIKLCICPIRMETNMRYGIEKESSLESLRRNLPT